MYNTVYPLLKGVPELTGSVEPSTHTGKHVGDERKRVMPSQGQLLLFTVLKLFSTSNRTVVNTPIPVSGDGNHTLV